MSIYSYCAFVFNRGVKQMRKLMVLSCFLCALAAPVASADEDIDFCEIFPELCK